MASDGGLESRETIGAVGKMRDVRRPVDPFTTQCLQLLLILMGAYNHDVRTHVKLAAR